MSLSTPRRVVVTGLGMLTSLGVGVNHVWGNILKGECGIQRLNEKEYEKIPCRVAGTIPIGTTPGALNIDKYLTKAEQRSMSLGSSYAIIAAEEAIRDSNWFPQSEEEKCRTGVAVGMGMVSLRDIGETIHTLQNVGYNRVSPHFVPKILVNIAAGYISLRNGFKGVNHAVSTACTTGAHAVGDAARFIKYGDVDVMICGGSEASICPVGMAGFARMRALSTHFNDVPKRASRPFDKNRDGFVMAEGAGILVLEELEHACRRNAKIYAEILGYGLSADANHITAPTATGDGAYRCMDAALRDAKLKPSDITYFNAHATSTPIGDIVECMAITRLVGRDRIVPVSSTKGAVGHLLGAAGSVEAIFTILSCQTGQLPPTLNCDDPLTDFNLDFVPHHSKCWPDVHRRIALTNSFGFGGTNASLCIGQYV